MSRAAVVAASVLTSGVSFAQAPLYEARIHVVDAHGETLIAVVESTKGGVAKEECEVRRAAWWNLNKTGTLVGVEKMRAQGKAVSVHTSCDLIQ